jgi:pyroglutamyl-peptidase
VFFGLAHLLATQHPHIRGGFIHVPCLPEQAERHPGSTGMTLPIMIQAVTLSLEVALTTREDLHYAAGTTY